MLLINMDQRVPFLVFFRLGQQPLNQSRAVVIHLFVRNDRFCIGWKALSDLLQIPKVPNRTLGDPDCRALTKYVLACDRQA